MSNKPRTWTELRKRRERSGSANNSPSHHNSFHLTTDLKDIGTDDSLIHTFEHFQILRKTFTNLRTLPTPMYRDWIACCQKHISDDIIGNTPQENNENHHVAFVFKDFSEEYEAFMKDSSIDEDVRTQQIQLSLLNLLRKLLTKPTNLAKNILKNSISEV